MFLTTVDKQVGVAIKLYIFIEVSGSNLGGVTDSEFCCGFPPSVQCDVTTVCCV